MQKCWEMDMKCKSVWRGRKLLYKKTGTQKSFKIKIGNKEIDADYYPRYEIIEDGKCRKS